MRHLVFVLFCTLAMVCTVQSAFVQQAQAQSFVDGLPDYETWDKVVARAHEAIDNDLASDAAFEDLRAELVEWRTLFQGALSINSTRIGIISKQIDALGTLVEGQEEASDLAERRKELEDQRAELRKPVIDAEEAYLLADSLIHQIDQTFRSRKTSNFLKRGPSPIQPSVWTAAGDALSTLFIPMRSELQTAWQNEVTRKEMRNNIGSVLFFAIIGSFCLLSGRRFMARLTVRVQGDDPSPARWIAAFIVSLGQVLLPFLGIALLVIAAYETQLIGVHLDAALSSLAGLGLSFFIASWLGAKIFPKGKQSDQFLNLTPSQCREGRLYSAGLGLMYGIYSLIGSLLQYNDLPDAAKSGLYFPAGVFTAVMLFRLSQLLVIHARASETDTEPTSSIYNNLGMVLARLTMATAFLGPILALLGYFNAAIRVTFPTVASLALIAFLALILRLFQETFVLATGDKEKVGKALTPILINIFVVLLSLPLFALIWGARASDISEVWSKFREGFTVGDVSISPTSFLFGLVVFIIAYTITKVVQATLRSTVLPRTKLDSGGQNAAVVGIGYVGLAISALVAVTAAGINLSAFAIVAGALSVGIGFGLQTIVSNFVSGLILLVERPISEGDWIEVNGQMGYVRDIAVRATRIETFDRTDVIIPNGDLVSGVVTNWTRGNSIGRLILPVGVGYGTDTALVEKILRDVANDHPMVVAVPPPNVLFRNFGADALEFEIRAILRDVNWIVQVQSDMNHQIVAKFREAGIEIPFAQRDLWLRNPEVLANSGSGAPKPKETEENEDDPSALS